MQRFKSAIDAVNTTAEKHFPENVCKGVQKKVKDLADLFDTADISEVELMKVAGDLLVNINQLTNGKNTAPKCYLSICSTLKDAYREYKNSQGSQKELQVFNRLPSPPHSNGDSSMTHLEQSDSSSQLSKQISSVKSLSQLDEVILQKEIEAKTHKSNCLDSCSFF